MKFSSYNLNQSLLNALKDSGYTDATPIQEAVISKALKKKSLLCKAETGSGKTHAFLIPVLNNIDPENKNIQAVIVTPTVELANQTYRFAKDLADKLGNVNVKIATSGSAKDLNSEDLSKLEKATILIGTPGRVYDMLLGDNEVNKNEVSVMVLDECDMLLDEAYVHQIEELLTRISPKQRLAFTATMKEHLLSSTKSFIKVDEVIDVNKKDKVNGNVSHHLVDIKHKNLTDQLVNFLNVKKPYYTLVFASQKTQVEKIHHELNERGIENALLTGDLESRERKITMRRIRNGEFKLVLCSDIASRGIDLEDITCVISLDLPVDFDYYYHRAGRTGRNNKQGDSYVFYNDDDKKRIAQLVEKSKLNFDYYVLREDSLKKNEEGTKKKKEVNENLEKEIRKAAAKARTKKVKPCYKKKVRQAVEKAKWFHKTRIVRSNIHAAQKKNSKDSSFNGGND